MKTPTIMQDAHERQKQVFIRMALEHPEYPIEELIERVKDETRLDWLHAVRESITIGPLDTPCTHPGQ